MTKYLQRKQKDKKIPYNPNLNLNDLIKNNANKQNPQLLDEDFNFVANFNNYDVKPDNYQEVANINSTIRDLYKTDEIKNKFNFITNKLDLDEDDNAKKIYELNDDEITNMKRSIGIKPPLGLIDHPQWYYELQKQVPSEHQVDFEKAFRRARKRLRNKIRLWQIYQIIKNKGTEAEKAKLYLAKKKMASLIRRVHAKKKLMELLSTNGLEGEYYSRMNTPLNRRNPNKYFTKQSHNITDYVQDIEHPEEYMGSNLEGKLMETINKYNSNFENSFQSIKDEN